MEIKYIIPMGYRFRPTDEELVTYYLSKKNKGQLLPEVNGKILERRMYGEDATPWNVLTERDPWEDLEGSKDKKFVYVFCKLIPMNGRSKSVRVCRTAGCGTWEGKAVGQEICTKGRSVVGNKRSFTFRPKKEFEKESEGKGHWIMHEYSLPSSGDRIGEDYVLCKVTKDLMKGGCHEVDEDDGVDSFSFVDSDSDPDPDHGDKPELVSEKRKVLDIIGGDVDNDAVLLMKKKNPQGFESEEVVRKKNRQGLESQGAIVPYPAYQEVNQWKAAVDSCHPSVQNENQLDGSVYYLGNIEGSNEDNSREVDDPNYKGGFDIEDHLMEQQKRMLSLVRHGQAINLYTPLTRVNNRIHPHGNASG